MFGKVYKENIINTFLIQETCNLPALYQSSIENTDYVIYIIVFRETCHIIFF